MKWLCGELGIPGWSWDCDTVQYVLQGSQPEIFGSGQLWGRESGAPGVVSRERKRVSKLLPPGQGLSQTAGAVEL